MMTMKKIFFTLVAMLTLASCFQEELPGTDGVGNGEGGYVELEFGVVLPDMVEATRTLSSPQIDKLHLLVFDQNGLLSEAVEAELVNGWGVSATTETQFTARLARSDYKRTIHFVANSPRGIDDYPLSTATAILNAMTVSGQQDAYWQCVELPNGITGKQGKDTDGNVIYVPSEDVTNRLTRVPLVRNNARVKVVNALQSNQTQLNDMAFVLVNIPSSGTVAPFNNNTGEFVNFTDATNYAALETANYEGFEPTNAEFINNTFTGGALNCAEGYGWVTATAATDTNGGCQYLYEHKQTLNPAYVIISGKFGTSDKTTYYKVDIINTDINTGDVTRYHLLRNIQYTINITGVIGEGFDTAEEAYNAGPTNNLNYSVETKSLLNLSDGEKVLYVEYTQKIINKTAATVTMRYKYIDMTKTGDAAILTDEVEITKGPETNGKVIDGNINEGDNTTTSDGWNTLSFVAGVLPAEGESAKTQTIKLKAGSLAREVEFILARPFKLELVMPKKGGNTLGAAINATLKLEERLPYGIFPLEFIIVAENNSLSPDAARNTLPVVCDVNADGTPGGQHFGYKYTLDYDQYYSIVNGTETFKTEIPLHFKTNMADAAPEGVICSAYNPYHNIAQDELYTGSLLYLSMNPKTTYVDYGQNLEFTVTLRLPEDITDEAWGSSNAIEFVISDSNDALQLMSVSGAGGKTGDSSVRVERYNYETLGMRTVTLQFKTLKDVSATTIYAENEYFKQATSVVLNNVVGRLGLALDTASTILLGAGQLVDVTIEVPADVEKAFSGDNLTLTLTTDVANYVELDTTRAATITQKDTKTFTVVLSKTEYDAAISADGVATIPVKFKTSTGNISGKHSITVSHPYMTSDAVSVVTKRYQVTWSLPDTLSNSDKGTGNLTVTLPDGLTSDMFPLSFTVNASMQYTRITFDGSSSSRVGDSSRSSSTGTYTFQVTYANYTSSKTRDIQFAPRGDTYHTGSFTISLSCTNSNLDMPGAITKTYSSSYYR